MSNYSLAAVAASVLVPPDFREKLKAALAAELPVKGFVCDPDGVVHAIIGNYTRCDLEWAYGDLPHMVPGWVLAGAAHLTCLTCIGDE